MTNIQIWCLLLGLNFRNRADMKGTELSRKNFRFGVLPAASGWYSEHESITFYRAFVEGLYSSYFE